MQAPVFRRVRAGSRVLVVDPELETGARALGLLEPGRVEALLVAGAGAAGRGRTAVLALPGTDLRVVLRPVLHGGLLGPLLGAALWGLGRPLRELERTARLRGAGAPVPRPAFVVGRRTAGPVFSAAVGTVEEAGTRDALAFLLAGPDPLQIAGAARAAGRSVRRFHDAGGRHADLHVKNLLLRERAGGPDCLLVDLDRVSVGAAPSPAARMAELMRLYRSLVKRGFVERVGRRGVAAFLGAYAGRDRALRAGLLSKLPRERRKLALHALRYRRR